MAKAGLGMRGALAGLVLLAVAGCSAVYRNHGYAPTDTELAEIAVGRDDRDTVAAEIGRPSAEGLLSDDSWYYVQSRWRHLGARAPQEVDRQVVVVSYAANGMVENVERFGLENGNVVPLSRRVTSTNVKGISLIQQLLRNVGQLDAGRLLND